ncbi:MAG: SocA family protein [Prevotella sp.]|jgi:uncharacterized phage-associated protein|nr:SocA family protein [Prevotella sp.]
MESKILAFGYMTSLFLDWYREENEIENIQDCCSAFSKLSLLKLLFLGAAIKTDEDSDLLDVFNNFSALPYGPVESDVYNGIIEDNIPRYTIGDRSIQIKENDPIINIQEELRLRIDNSINTLRNTNPNLINSDAFELVEITHKWKSWADAYSFAEFLGQRGYTMRVDEIKNDPNQYFGL